jgi:hypothetical protein
MDDSKENKIEGIKVILYKLEKYIEMVFWNLTKNMNVPEENRPRINMKSEYYYSRLLLTRNKRNYAGLMISQENKLLKKPKEDIKGLPIKKVTTIKTVRDEYKNILNNILTSKKLKLTNILQKYIKLEKMISDCLKNKDVDYLIPSNLKNKTSYKFPYRIEAYKGSLFWNHLKLGEPLNPPMKVDLIYIKKNDEKVINALKEKGIYDKIEELYKKDEILEKYGFECLAVPKGLEKIPEWLDESIIDIDRMVMKHIANGLILLDSCNISIITVNSKKAYTNLIEF